MEWREGRRSSTISLSRELGRSVVRPASYIWYILSSELRCGDDTDALADVSSGLRELEIHSRDSTYLAPKKQSKAHSQGYVH